MMTKSSEPNSLPVPQVMITLGPSGSLQAEIGWAGGRRVVELQGDIEGTLLRMLHGQLARRTAIGLDGAPTAAQVKHWECHGIFPDERCPFCRAESPAGTGAGVRKRAPKRVLAEHDGVVIRLAVGKGRRKLEQHTRKTAAELGL